MVICFNRLPIQRIKEMKRIKAWITILGIAGTVLMTGCSMDTTLNPGVGTEENTVEKGGIKEADGSVKCYADTLDGVEQYVNVRVTSFRICADKIENPVQKQLVNIPSKYNVSQDGTLTGEYKFAEVGISIDSEKDMDVNLTGFSLTDEAGEWSAECYYNNSPKDDNDAQNSGEVSLNAGETKDVIIGFFITQEQAEAEKYELIPMFVYTGDEVPQIEIKK